MTGYRVNADKLRSITYDRQKRMLRVRRQDRPYPIWVDKVNIVYTNWCRLLTLDAVSKTVSFTPQRVSYVHDMVHYYDDAPSDPLDECAFKWYTRLHWRNPSLNYD
jgi:hypothetical protein